MTGQEIIYRINGRECSGTIVTPDINGYFVENTFGAIAFVSHKCVIVIL